MKILFIGLFTFVSMCTNASESILHHNCEIWVPTWQPQGQGNTQELSNLLVAKGYKPIFSSLGSTRDSKPLYLGQNEIRKTEPNLFIKGSIQLTLKLEMINGKGEYSDLVIVQQSVTCKYRYNGRSYFKYDNNCSVQLKDSAAQLPDCTISNPI